MSNIAILNLSPLSWRGINLYVSSIETSFTHRQVERAYPYVDVPGHDWTGFDGVKVSATVHFLNTIEAGMYPGKWVEFRDAIFDGSSGPLVHPDLGGITARVLDGNYRIAATTTAGVLVSVQWTQTRDEVEDEATFSAADGGEEAAEAADEALEELDLIYPDGEPDTSLSDTIGAIEGAVFSYGQQIGGAINQAKGLVGKHIQALDLMGQAWRFADPGGKDANAGNSARAVAETNLYNLYASLGKRAEDAAKKARPVAIHLVKASSPMTGLAAALGNSLDDLLGLNPSLASSPTVPAGSRVIHYVKA